MVLEVLPWAVGADSKVRHWTWSKVAKRRQAVGPPNSPGHDDAAEPGSPGEDSKAIKDGEDGAEPDLRTTVIFHSLVVYEY